MGLSTVSQNLTILEGDGLIERNGYFDSTGGRKAHAIRIVPDFKISIGIGILKNMFHIFAVDLYGNAVNRATVALAYSNTPSYYEQVCEKIRDFIAENHYETGKILGVSIATQGITSPDHNAVTYGIIMDNTGMNLRDFSQHLPYPCHLEHDSKSAACLETYCSANALEQSSELSVKEFFPLLREKKIPTPDANLGRLSELSGICHEKLKYDN